MIITDAGDDFESVKCPLCGKMESEEHKPKEPCRVVVTANGVTDWSDPLE